MKFKNFLLVIAAFLFVCNTGFAQSSKSKSKAVKKTEKLNTALKSSNPALALNESQKEQITALYLERMEEVAAFRKTNSNEDEVKAKSKELNKALKGKLQDILTPEQANAQKASRKNKKGTTAKGAAKASKKAKNGAASISDAEVEEIYAAASEKQVARAEKSTEKLNAKLTAADTSLALSDDQRKKITAVNLKSGLKAAKMKKEGLSKEEIKAKNKEFVKSNKRLIKSILTKEQKDATKKKK